LFVGFAFSVLTRLDESQEGHPACGKLSVGMFLLALVIRWELDANDLHVFYSSVVFIATSIIS